MRDIDQAVGWSQIVSVEKRQKNLCDTKVKKKSTKNKNKDENTFLNRYPISTYYIRATKV